MRLARYEGKKKEKGRNDVFKLKKKYSPAAGCYSKLDALGCASHGEHLLTSSYFILVVLCARAAAPTASAGFLFPMTPAT